MKTKLWQYLKTICDRTLKASDDVLKAPKLDAGQWQDEIRSVSTTHTQVTGMLAGFSATIVVLIIGLHFGKNINLKDQTPAEVSLGIFAMAFFGYVATGILYSISVERYGEHRSFLFSTASIIYYFSGILSFAAVYPLIRLIESSALKWGVLIMVVGGMLGGYLAAAIPLRDLLLIKRKYIFGILLASVSTSIAFYVLLTLGFGIQNSALLGWLLFGCAAVVVTAFNFVAFTFFFPLLNRGDLYRLTSLVLIALATVTLCFAILVGARAGS